VARSACRARLLPEGYRPREPERTLYYRTIRDNVRTFLAAAAERDPSGRGVPKHVERSFEAFLDCGILSKGFGRVRCSDCGYDLAVPFS
jgi:hypothetical protein